MTPEQFAALEAWVDAAAEAAVAQAFNRHDYGDWLRLKALRDEAYAALVKFDADGMAIP